MWYTKPKDLRVNKDGRPGTKEKYLIINKVGRSGVKPESSIGYKRPHNKQEWPMWY